MYELQIMYIASFFFTSRRRDTRCRRVSLGRECGLETGAQKRRTRKSSGFPAYVSNSTGGEFREGVMQRVWHSSVQSISGLVVEYIVAIDVTRVRFPADASTFGPKYFPKTSGEISEDIRRQGI